MLDMSRAYPHVNSVLYFTFYIFFHGSPETICFGFCSLFILFMDYLFGEKTSWVG